MGPRPAPSQWTETWRRMNPDFSYRLWDQAAIDELGLENEPVFRRYIRAALFDGAADIARIEILRRLGGVYVDADSIALRPLRDAPFMHAGFFAQREPTDRRRGLITNAFIGAVPNHPVLDRYVDVVSRIRSLRPMSEVSGRGALTRVLETQEHTDVMILPAWTFFTRSLDGEEQTGGPSYAAHFWSTTAERWGHEHATPYPRQAPTDRRCGRTGTRRSRGRTR